MYDLDNLKLESAMDKSRKWNEIAQKYLNQHENFKSIKILTGFLDKQKQFYNKTIYYKDFKFEASCQVLLSGQIASKTVQEKRQALSKLASLVDEKSELICALEISLRQQLESDLKTYLSIVKNQLLSYEMYDIVGCFCNCRVYLRADTPLLVLGYLHEAIFKYGGIVIFATVETAPIASLFMEMIDEAGFMTNVGLCVVDKIDDKRGVLNVFTEMHECDSFSVPLRECSRKMYTGECTAVVTSRCDLDSAVDKLVSSSPNAPWRIQRVLVQENVYENFKKALKWKYDLETNKKTTQSPELSYFIQGNLFIFDPARRDVTKVTVEAYRTTKELIKLLSEYQPYYLSLWSNDIAEAHEITNNVSSTIIWINDHASFNTSRPVFNLMYPILNNYFVSSLCTGMKEWSKLVHFERKKAILKSLDDYLCDENDDEARIIKDIRVNVLNEENNVLIQDSNTSLEVRKVVGENIIHFSVFSIKCIMAALYGQGASVSYINEKLLQSFRNNGVPIVSDRCSIPKKFCTQKYQLIWSNYGTIFAN